MQVVIEIDDNLYTRLFDNGDEYIADMRRACVAIRKGTPLSEVLEDIKAEIEQYENDCMLSCANNDDCRDCNDNTFGSIYRTIEKRTSGKEQE